MPKTYYDRARSGNAQHQEVSKNIASIRIRSGPRQPNDTAMATKQPGPKHPSAHYTGEVILHCGVAMNLDGGYGPVALSPQVLQLREWPVSLVIA